MMKNMDEHAFGESPCTAWWVQTPFRKSKRDSFKPLCIGKSFTASENNRPSRNGKHLACMCSVGVRNSIPTADKLIENDRNNIIIIIIAFIIIYIIHYKCTSYVLVRTGAGRVVGTSTGNGAERVSVAKM